jgi:hypothetical protein
MNGEPEGVRFNKGGAGSGLGIFLPDYEEVLEKKKKQ